MFPAHIQKLIATYRIMGIIPLDKFLHFFVGLVITVVLRYAKLSFKTIFLIILGLCLIKESIDIRRLNSSLLESVVDTLVTYLYPIMLLGVIWMKRKLREK